jgi:hypothetical protein
MIAKHAISPAGERCDTFTCPGINCTNTTSILLAGQEHLHRVTDTNGLDVVVTLTTIDTDSNTLIDTYDVMLAIRVNGDYYLDDPIRQTASSYRVSTQPGGQYEISVASFTTPLSFSLKVCMKALHTCAGNTIQAMAWRHRPIRQIP